VTRCFFALLVLFFCVSHASAQLVNDAAKVNALKPGEATPEDVKASFGEPEHIDKNPDGRFAHLYELELKDTKDSSAPPLRGKIVFLFDKDGKLVRYRVYKQN
jgi:hypothetical protein